LAHHKAVQVTALHGVPGLCGNASAIVQEAAAIGCIPRPACTPGVELLTHAGDGASREAIDVGASVARQVLVVWLSTHNAAVMHGTIRVCLANLPRDDVLKAEDVVGACVGVKQDVLGELAAVACQLATCHRNVADQSAAAQATDGRCVPPCLAVHVRYASKPACFCVCSRTGGRILKSHRPSRTFRAVPEQCDMPTVVPVRKSDLVEVGDGVEVLFSTRTYAGVRRDAMADASSQ